MKVLMITLSRSSALSLKAWKSLIIRWIGSKTFKDTGWMLSGTLLARGLGLVSFTILTRVLGPTEYGLLSIALAVLSMAIDMSDLGMDTSVVRYAAEYAADKDWTSLSKLLSILLRSRLVISIVVFCIGMLVARPLAVTVFKEPAVTLYLYLAFGGLFGALFNSAFVAVLQANQQFERVALVNLVAGASNAVGVIALWTTATLTSVSALVVYLISPFLATAVGYLLVPRHLVSFRLWDKEIAHKLFHFSKWMALWAFVRVLQNRLDIFMLTNQMSATDVGHYNAAYRIALLASLVPFAYGTVLTTKFASLAGTSALIGEFKKTLLASCFLAAIIFGAAFLVPWVIPLWIGEAYVQSMPVVRVLLWAWAISTLNLPFSSVLYATEKPAVISLATVATLFQTFFSNLVLIPRLGATGAAVSLLLSVVLVGFACAVSVVHLYRKNKWQTSSDRCQKRETCR